MSTDYWFFIKKQEKNILGGLILLILALVSFKAGQIFEQTKSANCLEVQTVQKMATNPREEKILEIAKILEEKGLASKLLASNEASSLVAKETKEQASDQLATDCKFIASKNSKIYHKPDCSSTKRIKSENQVCFASEEEAQSRNFTPAKDCHK